MTNAELFKFACQCLLLDGDNILREYVADKFEKGSVDPDRLVFLLSNHFVLPAVTLKFKKYGLLHFFPRRIPSTLSGNTGAKQDTQQGNPKTIR